MHYKQHGGFHVVECFCVFRGWCDFCWAFRRESELLSLIGLEQWEMGALGLCFHRLVGSEPQGNTPSPSSGKGLWEQKGGGRSWVGVAVPTASPHSSGPFLSNGYWPNLALHALFGIFSPSLCFSSSAFLCFLRAIIRADRLVGGRIWHRHCLSSFYLLILLCLPYAAFMCWHAHVIAWGATNTCINIEDISQFLAFIHLLIWQ